MTVCGEAAIVESLRWEVIQLPGDGADGQTLIAAAMAAPGLFPV